MNVIVFDCEANGLPVSKKREKVPMSVVDNWPRVIQIGIQVYNDAGLLLFACDYKIKPDGWVVPAEGWHKEHGFSTEDCEKNGVPIAMVFELLLATILQFDINTIVCHNVKFDYNVLGAEMIRYGVTTGRVMRKICTAEMGSKVTRIPFGRDRRPWKNKTWKFPSLGHLYLHLFKDLFQGAHDAQADTFACAKCFFRLVELGIIVL